MTITFAEPPLSHLNDPADFLEWHREVGEAEATRQLTEATRAHMQKHGVRSVLEVVERMDHVIAVMEEYAT